MCVIVAPFGASFVAQTNGSGRILYLQMYTDTTVAEL